MLRREQLFRALTAAIFVAQFVLIEVAFGGRLGSPASAIASVFVWAALLAFARTRRRRVVVALLAGLIVTSQAFVYRYYHVPLDLQIAEGARHAWHDIRRVVLGVMPTFALAVVVVSAIELVVLESARPVLGASARPRWTLGLAAAAAIVLVSLVDPRRATPDVRAVHALGALGREPLRPIEGAVALPALHSDRPSLPDVLFVFTESVRAADYVTAGERATAPETLAATPGRTDLAELRAVSSYSAVSLSAVLTARAQDEPRDAILKAPNLFDFAHAARMHVAYYTGHSRETFESKDVRAAVDRFFSLETIAGHEIDDDEMFVHLPLDRIVVDRFTVELGAVNRPLFAMLHLASTHAPYFVDEDRAPFQPWSQSVAWSDMPKLHNAYRNAIYEQDRTLARAIRAFVEHAGARPWLVVFTSDHGESFGEGGAIHHGQNLYDEQVHVPGFVVSGNGALRAGELAALADHRDRFVTHLDLLPTVLDALGLWDNFSVAPHRERMSGRSLLRPWSERPPLAVTNCTAMFRCPLNTWGIFEGDHKLIAQAWDGGWRCLALRGGEHEAPAGDPSCASLIEASRAHYRELPNGQPNR